MKKEKAGGYGCVVLAAVSWGVIGLFSRKLGELGMTMGNRVFARLFFALILFTIGYLLFYRQVFCVQWKHLPLFAAHGLIGVLGMTVAYFNCQAECSLAVAGTLTYLAPPIVVLVSAVLWKAKITRRKTVALLMALVGCALVSGMMGGVGQNSLRGILFGVASGCCYAGYTVFAHYGLQHYDGRTVSYWAFVFAGLGSIFLVDVPNFIAVAAHPDAWWAMAGVCVLGAVVPFLLYTVGLSTVEEGRAAILANIEPVVGAIAGAIAFHEVPDEWIVLGMVGILGAAAILGTKEQT